MPQGPALVIDVSALQFGLLRLGQKATKFIQIRNLSQLPATWAMKESQVSLQERQEGVSPAHHLLWCYPAPRRRLTRVMCEPWHHDTEAGAFRLGEEKPAW